ncbi:hypothetical protein C0993_000228 [Termitomyces sp. T159_Od127]|nr:hypothetical protein C0993_000228 [Termitomyces sp. T159_Od127]
MPSPYPESDSDLDSVDGSDCSEYERSAVDRTSTDHDDRILDEVLRISSVSPFLVRECVEDLAEDFDRYYSDIEEPVYRRKDRKGDERCLYRNMVCIPRGF